jgi:hypothetical protein
MLLDLGPRIFFYKPVWLTIPLLRGMWFDTILEQDFDFSYTDMVFL